MPSFFLNDTAPTKIYPLSLHAALPFLLESSGCKIADDDFSIAKRWFKQNVPATADPVRALAESYVLDAEHSLVSDDFTSRRVQTSLTDRKSTRLNSSHTVISYAVFFFK